MIFRMNPFDERIRMPVIGVYAVATMTVFVLWFSFVFVMGRYHVGGMSQQWYSFVMARLACVVPHQWVYGVPGYILL